MYHFLGIFAADYIWYLISGFEPKYYAELRNFTSSDLSNFWFTMFRGSILFFPFQLALFAISWFFLSIFYRRFVTRISGFGFWFFLFFQWIFMLIFIFSAVLVIIKRNANLDIKNLLEAESYYSNQIVLALTVIMVSLIFWMTIKFLQKLRGQFNDK